jgi:hypothetical protein
VVKKIKRNSGSDDALKRNIIIVFEVAILLTLIVTVVAVFKSDLSPFKEEPTLYITTQRYTEESATGEGLSIPMTKDDESKPKDNNNNKQPGGYAPVTNSQNNVAANFPDPSGWSTAQIISTAKAAVNKTKAYTGNLTVNHSESFSANVTECSAGGIVRSVVDLMIGWVVKPVEETLVYQNGLAVNSEGETVPIILPKKNNFTLTEKGVKSATVQRVGNEYIIRINLVRESVGMYEVPTHNAASVGYLDVANFDISFMEVDSADIVYKGSSIELRINADGYVTYANYRIPLHIDGSAHKGSISGSASFEGEQTEEWRLNY